MAPPRAESGSSEGHPIICFFCVCAILGVVSEFPKVFLACPEDAGKRLDQFLAAEFPESSRARVQQLIAENKVLVNDATAKSSLRLRGDETITITSALELPPLRAIPEEIPLNIIYEDDDLAVIDKPAGMMVHAGAGSTEADRNRGTLVNALLHRFQKLSGVGGRVAARDRSPPRQSYQRIDCSREK